MKIRDNTANLDAIDWQILELLRKNARQTYSAIGRNVGLAHATIYDRIKRMEQYGVIKKYTAIIDLEKAGTKNITAIMTIFPDPKQSEKVAEKLCQAPQVVEVYTSLSEELLIIAKVIAENQEDLHEFIARSEGKSKTVKQLRVDHKTIRYNNQMAIVYPCNSIFGWSPSAADCLSNDWILL